jgi:hypothetical protein
VLSLWHLGWAPGLAHRYRTFAHDLGIVVFSRDVRMNQSFRIAALAGAIAAGSMVTPGSVARADHEGELFITLITVGTAWVGLNVASVTMSSIRLAQGEQAEMGRSIFGYALGALNLGIGLFAASDGNAPGAGIFLGIGALTLTMAILARVMNAPPDVVVAPVVSEDVAGNITYGLGLTFFSL